jgi:hypothetical protein
MKSAKACVEALVLLVAGGAAIMGQDKPEGAAQKAAEKWLTLIDAGEYGQSWDEAAAVFKAAVTKEQWVQAVKNVRDQTGKLNSRKLVRADYTKTLPNAPEGEYVLMQYEASFEKGSAVEAITPMREKDGSWKVSGYFVKPKE